MMKIGSMNSAAVNGAGGGVQAGKSGMQMQTDPVSKNIQNQIANAQKQLQEVSASQEMTPEQKMKKRQEIQQEITSLNQQLRQHQIEQRKEQQAKDSSVNDMPGARQGAGKAASGNQGSGLSQAGMKAMLTADSSVKQAQIQGKVAAAFEGRAGVLKAEIKQGGGNIEAKEAELAEVEQKAVSATASQMNTLAEASRTVEEAAKEEQSSANRTDTSDTKAENKADKNDKAKQDKKETGKISDAANKTVAQPQETSAAAEVLAESSMGAAVQADTSKHINIRL